MRRFFKTALVRASKSPQNSNNGFAFSTANDKRQTIEVKEAGSSVGSQEAKSGREGINRELLSGLNEYKEALNFFQNGKYRISEEFFRRTLKILEKADQMQSDNYVHVLKK